ncbi:MAG: hypothetical protein JWM64_1197 [Frankiales bacterium]|nr:hypothetical protein [Frankiales bacterium]
MPAFALLATAHGVLLTCSTCLGARAVPVDAPFVAAVRGFLDDHLHETGPGVPLPRQRPS